MVLFASVGIIVRGCSVVELQMRWNVGWNNKTFPVKSSSLTKIQDSNMIKIDFSRLFLIILLIQWYFCYKININPFKRELFDKVYHKMINHITN